MTKAIDLDLRHSAYHESGHAAVALYLGCLVRELYVEDKRVEFRGSARFDIPLSVSKEEALINASIVGLSGIPSALKHDPARDPRGTGDRRLVKKHLGHLPTNQQAHLLTKFEERATDLVHQLWPLISALAEAVEAASADRRGRRTLDQTAIYEIRSWFVAT